MRSCPELQVTIIFAIDSSIDATKLAEILTPVLLLHSDNLHFKSFIKKKASKN